MTHSKSGGIPVTGIEYLDPLRVVRLGLVDAAGRRSVSVSLTPGNTRETYGGSGFSGSEHNYLNAFRTLFAPEENGPEYTFASWTPGSGAPFGTPTLSRAGQCAPGNATSEPEPLRPTALARTTEPRLRSAQNRGDRRRDGGR